MWHRQCSIPCNTEGGVLLPEETRLEPSLDNVERTCDNGTAHATNTSDRGIQFEYQYTTMNADAPSSYEVLPRLGR